MRFTPEASWVDKVHTPAWVIDEARILQQLNDLQHRLIGTNTNLLFPLKAFTQRDMLKKMAPHLSGFAASSVFETRLAHSLIQDQQTLHFTSPGMRPDEEAFLVETADYLSGNSLGQLARLRDKPNPHASIGLRINPQQSFVEDPRYDPCGAHSKLGVPIDQLANHPQLARQIDGLHFHNHCESYNFRPLLQTVEHMIQTIPDLVDRVSWINLGGGYVYDEADDQSCFEQALELLQRPQQPQLFIEPGYGIVGDAACLISTVVDRFHNGQHDIAVLDTSVNHQPEILEYGYTPEIAEASPTGKHTTLLSGSTCLAGDAFGFHTFDQPLDIGSRITFLYAGAYSMVKAHTFNGLNLPTVYTIDATENLSCIQEHRYEDYLTKHGAKP